MNPMKPNDLYKFLAATLPVLLVVGLLYLHILGEMSVSSVMLCFVGMVLLVPVVGILADAASEEQGRLTDARRRRAWMRLANHPPGDSQIGGELL